MGLFSGIDAISLIVCLHRICGVRESIHWCRGHFHRALGRSLFGGGVIYMLRSCVTLENAENGAMMGGD